MVDVEDSDHLSLSRAEMDRLFGLMIHAYEVTESEIWGPNYIRMPREEYDQLLLSRRILIARIKGRIVGSIYYYPLSEDRYVFGLLNADFNEKGKGIGRTLILAAENRARLKGARFMQLEILRPDSFVIPQKERLKLWYQSLGYSYVNTLSFLELKFEKVEKAKKLITPSSFDVYEKSLDR